MQDESNASPCNTRQYNIQEQQDNTKHEHNQTRQCQPTPDNIQQYKAMQDETRPKQQANRHKTNQSKATQYNNNTTNQDKSSQHKNNTRQCKTRQDKEFNIMQDKNNKRTIQQRDYTITAQYKTVTNHYNTRQGMTARQYKT